MDEPVTLWIDRLRSGDPQAAERLWVYFRDRLHTLARTRLGPNIRRVYDEDDLALSAFHSLCRGITEGRFSDLHDRTGLEKLLMTITTRKIAARTRYDLRGKRDIARVVNESDLPGAPAGASSMNLGLDRLAGDDPLPDVAAELAETCDALFATLEDESLQQIALLKLEGFDAVEIAGRLNCTRRTVERKLERIRRRWQAVLDADESSAKE